MNAAAIATKRIALVGCGAIGHAVLELLRGDAAARVVRVVIPSRDHAAARTALRSLAPEAEVAAGIDLGAGAPDLVVECAGHAAIVEHVLPALAAGVPAVVASIGALHDSTLATQLADAAVAGGTQVQLVSGAIGAVDALAAAALGGLERVHYIGRKPPQGWRGTPAEALCDLGTLTEARTLFDGSAREAARLYPKNANVAATVSLAGIGLDDTRATLIADPGVRRNVHRLVAEGAFGKLDLTIENEPLAANPKTSALTVYSIVRAIHNATRVIAL
ncbi:MAG: aspartate dehydrogenase [Rubrivivax sp.]|nr:aspartate dehydrogenase [Rubrivivax sp.]